MNHLAHLNPSGKQSRRYAQPLQAHANDASNDEAFDLGDELAMTDFERVQEAFSVQAARAHRAPKRYREARH